MIHYCLHLDTPHLVVPWPGWSERQFGAWSIPGNQVSNAVAYTVPSRIQPAMEGPEMPLGTGLSHMEAHSAPQTWVTCGS